MKRCGRTPIAPMPSSCSVSVCGGRRQRHGAGDEVAAQGALDLAADRRWRGASKCDAARNVARLRMLMALLVRLSDSEIEMIELMIA